MYYGRQNDEIRSCRNSKNIWNMNSSWRRKFLNAAVVDLKTTIIISSVICKWHIAVNAPWRYKFWKLMVLLAGTAHPKRKKNVSGI